VLHCEHLFVIIIVCLPSFPCLNLASAMSYTISRLKYKIPTTPRLTRWKLSLNLSTPIHDSAMYVPRSSTEGHRNAQDVKADSLKLRTLVDPNWYLFPILPHFIVFILYRFTIKRDRDKIALLKQEAGVVGVGKLLSCRFNK
jgi:hypothetical protein